MPTVQYLSEEPSDSLFEAEGRPLRQLTWDDNNHWAIMTRIYGSAIPATVPFCVWNGVVTAIIYELKRRNIVDLTTSPSGHKYLAIIMSFLLVSRVRMIYNRYMQSAAALNGAYEACRDLVQWTCILSKVDQTERAKQWRHDVAYSVIIMLRTTMAVLEFESKPTEMPWHLADVDQQQNQDMQNTLFVSGSTDDRDNGGDDDSSSPPLASVGSVATTASTTTSNKRNLLAHTTAEERTLLEEACRAPIILAFNVRQTIMKQRDGTWFQDRNKVFYHPCNEETRLLDFVGDFLHHFHTLRQLMVTPLPFPLVNMAKIFLFLWVFTVPFAVCHFAFRGGVAVPVTIIVLMTFGFFGIEYVSIELTDPYGDDPSDFDNLGLAQIVFEDIYLSILRCDGAFWAQELRDRVVNRTALEEFRLRYEENFSSKRRRAASSVRLSNAKKRSPRHTVNAQAK